MRTAHNFPSHTTTLARSCGDDEHSFRCAWRALRDVGPNGAPYCLDIQPPPEMTGQRP